MADPLGRKEIIEFLVLRKFRSRRRGTSTLDRALRHEEKNKYRSELESLPVDQLQSLYESEQANSLADMQREEEAHFFNQPHARADFDYWSKAQHWSLDEAIALILGKAPEIVSWEKIKSHVGASPFVTQYSRLRNLTERAEVWGKLHDPVFPSIFLKWAEDNEITVPAEMSEKVSKLKGKLVDWKKQYTDMKAGHDRLRSGYDQLQEMHDQRIADWKVVAEKQSDLIESGKKRIAELESELVAIKGAPPAPAPAKTQSPIERQNMLKAIFGMAVKGYTYNPSDKRSKVVADIVTDLELEGIPLSDDTVRRYLKEAQDLLNEWRQEAG